MSQPKTREVSWLMMIGNIHDDTIWLCLEAEGKQKRYSLNGNEFRTQLERLRKSGFSLKQKRG